MTAVTLTLRLVISMGAKRAEMCSAFWGWHVAFRDASKRGQDVGIAARRRHWRLSASWLKIFCESRRLIRPCKRVDEGSGSWCYECFDDHSRKNLGHWGGHTVSVHHPTARSSRIGAALTVTLARPQNRTSSSTFNTSSTSFHIGGCAPFPSRNTERPHTYGSPPNSRSTAL